MSFWGNLLLPKFIILGYSVLTYGTWNVAGGEAPSSTQLFPWPGLIISWFRPFS